MPQSTQRSGSISAVTIVTIVVVVVAGTVWRVKSQADVATKKQLEKVADAVNQRTPMMVDGSTELSNAQADEGVLIYNYRLVKLAAADIPPDLLTTRLKPLVTNKSCTTPDSRDGLLNRGVALRYRYYDKDGSYLTEFEVRASDCH